MSKLPLSSITPDIPDDPITEEIEFRTKISGRDTEGEEQRKAKWLYPRRNLTIKYDRILSSQARLLWAFYISMKGSYRAFNVFLLRRDTYVSEYVGVGDGSTLIFNLPCSSSSAVTIYINGVAQATGYTITALGGPDGEDKITFTVAPNAGDSITIGFTGYLKVRSRFMEDTLSFDDFYRQITMIGLRTRGLLNA